MKINSTVIPASPSKTFPPPNNRASSGPGPVECFEPTNGIEWAGLVGGRMALVSTPVAAGIGVVTAALSGDASLGAKVGLGIAAAAGVAGGALGLTAYHAFKDLNIPS